MAFHSRNEARQREAGLSNAPTIRTQTSPHLLAQGGDENFCETAP
jgi:hypothetical protein